MEFSFIPPAGLLSSKRFRTACEIVARLKASGREAFFVGGAPRDMLLGIEPHDIDIATSARPEEVMKLFPRSIPIGAAFGVVNAVEDGMNFEIASFREERDYMDGRRPETIIYSDSFERDVARRDFTVNGLLFDPERSAIIDCVGGIEDIRKGVLRSIGDPQRRLSEDYLRILRAVRFCVRLRMEMDPALQTAIPPLASKIALLSAERLRDELDKMLLGPLPSRAFRMMKSLGLLKMALPEVDALSGVEQPKEHHPEGDVFEHTMLMLDRMSLPSRELAWSILLHDVGKPKCFSLGPAGVPRFYGHESEGASMSEKILARMKTPRAMIESVSLAVRNHMRFAHVHLMKAPKWRRMISAPNFPLEIELHRIDCMASHKKLANYALLLDRISSLSQERALPEPLLKGRDLVELGLRPGPKIGKALEKLADLQLDGLISTREDAIASLQKLGLLSKASPR